MTMNDVVEEGRVGGDIEEPLLRRRNVATDDGNDEAPRILDRGGAFRQSRGKWGIERQSRGIRIYDRPGKRCPRLWGPDWFHNLAYKPTLVLMMILFLIYTAIVFFFAFVYLGVSKLGAPKTSDDGSIKHSFCGMDINNHMEALYFSLSTMTTIG